MFSDQEKSIWINNLEQSEYFKKQMVQIGNVNHLVCKQDESMDSYRQSKQSTVLFTGK